MVEEELIVVAGGPNGDGGGRVGEKGRRNVFGAGVSKIF